MNNELKQKLRDALWVILDGHYKNSSSGICSLVFKQFTGYAESIDVECFLFNNFKKWPYYSGDFKYPININKKLSPCHDYWSNQRWEGEYGESRIQLVMFLLEQLGEPE